MRRTPLAWLQLVHDKRRLLAAVSGITFAAVLVLVQLGFRAALFTASSLVQDHLSCDIVLVSRQYDYLVFSKNLPEHRLYQALGFEGVESVTPMYLGLAQWKNPLDLLERTILVIGFDPGSAALRVPGLEEADPRRMGMPDVALFDTGSRSEFGPIAQILSEGRTVETEVNGRRIEVVGGFEMGTSFGVNGTIITSDLNFLRLFPGHPQNRIEFGLVDVKEGADVASIRAGLEELLPPDTRVLTRAEFSQAERDYWAWHTGIGFIFTLGALVGLGVGTVIVYQILYTDVSDHLPEYATLKALGYADRFLVWVVLQEAMILSALGFLPAVGIAQVIYWATRKATLLPMFLTPERAAVTFALTALMCAASGMLAMRKLRQADPAEVF